MSYCPRLGLLLLRRPPWPGGSKGLLGDPISGISRNRPPSIHGGRCGNTNRGKYDILICIANTGSRATPPFANISCGAATATDACWVETSDADTNSTRDCSNRRRAHERQKLFSPCSVALVWGETGYTQRLYDGSRGELTGPLFGQQRSETNEGLLLSTFLGGRSFWSRQCFSDSGQQGARARVDCVASARCAFCYQRASLSRFTVRDTSCREEL